MTLEDMQALWEKHSDEEYINFDRVQNKLSARADLHAFIMLDRLVPHKEGNNDIVSAAEHDEFWLEIDVNELAKVITEEQIIELLRCGVRYDDEFDCLAFFT